MEIYKVGGCVRDIILGVESSDTDFVVVNSSENEMLSLGYTKVGASFPVFLKDGNEYALARTEKSTGLGYHDFNINTTNVTLEEDLSRRDLTINSMAIDDDGFIVDPFDGQKDIASKTLRHTSEAFKDDPIRVLRLARFKCYLGIEWRIHSSTKLLVYSMRESLKTLEPQRVWKEVEKVFKLDNSSLFFKTLWELNVLDIIFPNIYKLTTCIENSKWHMETSVFEHSMQMLDNASSNIGKLFSIYHDIAKPSLILSQGHSGGHDSIKFIEDNNLIDMWIPTRLREGLLFYISNHIIINNLKEHRIGTQVKFFMQYKYIKNLLEQLSLAELDNQGAKQSVGIYEKIDEVWVTTRWQVVKEVKPTVELLERFKGKKLKDRLHELRVIALKQMKG